MVGPSRRIRSASARWWDRSPRSSSSTATTSWSGRSCSAGSPLSASAAGRVSSCNRGRVGNVPLKVAVYTIALNEAMHVDRWADSAVDADYRIIADTGSTDGTVERLREKGVIVHPIAIRPWRFDDARNAAMALIPGDVDVCVTMDMDVFLAPGWRPKLEAAWTEGTTALYIRMILRPNTDNLDGVGGSPSKSFHHRWGYRFKRPVHEALVFTGEQEKAHNCFDL